MPDGRTLQKRCTGGRRLADGRMAGDGGRAGTGGGPGGGRGRGKDPRRGREGGAACLTRTDDLPLTKRLLYQLS